jgi:hypothetical protein
LNVGCTNRFSAPAEAITPATLHMSSPLGVGQGEANWLCHASTCGNEAARVLKSNISELVRAEVSQWHMEQG